jgi:hypothetical protein
LNALPNDPNLAKPGSRRSVEWRRSGRGRAPERGQRKDPGGSLRAGVVRVTIDPLNLATATLRELPKTDLGKILMRALRDAA